MSKISAKISTVGVIISTCNNPRWLEKTLWSYLFQSRPADEIIIADDGSGPETAELIDSFMDKLPLRHVWHEDLGFRKTEILNKALLASRSDYLIFSDQDLPARADFISQHLVQAAEGYFLSGGCVRLPMAVSQALSYEDFANQRAFDSRWLYKQGVTAWRDRLKLQSGVGWQNFLNKVTPTRATWNGGNASCFRTAALAVNGFNEKMAYGGEDREFGERLENMGLKGRQVRYSALCLHLDHNRPYKNKEIIAKNRQIREITRRLKVVKTPFGIEKLQEGVSYYDKTCQS